MVSPGNQYGQWALVAGAAEGIGEGFTKHLASLGFNIILVDNKSGAMEQLARDVLATYNIETVTVLTDFANQDATATCMEAMAGRDCGLMVYVAGWSRVCRFSDLASEDLEGFLAVNTGTLLRLVHAFSTRLITQNKPGGIVLVSSLAGLIGPKYVATYAATKSFGIRLAEALYSELASHGIAIMAACSGTVATPTYLAGNPDLTRMRPPFMEPLEVARETMMKLGQKPVFIPGIKNRIQYFFLLNMVPRFLARKLVNAAMEKMYGHL